MIYFLIILTLIGSWYLPWWWIAVVGFLGGYRAHSAVSALLLGFMSVFCAWIPVAYYFDLMSHGLMSERLAQMFSLPYAPLIFLVTGAVGGFFSSVWSLFGFYLKRRI